MLVPDAAIYCEWTAKSGDASWELAFVIVACNHREEDETGVCPVTISPILRIHWPTQNKRFLDRYSSLDSNQVDCNFKCTGICPTSYAEYCERQATCSATLGD